MPLQLRGQGCTLKDETLLPCLRYSNRLVRLPFRMPVHAQSREGTVDGQSLSRRATIAMPLCVESDEVRQRTKRNLGPHLLTERRVVGLSIACCCRSRSLLNGITTDSSDQVYIEATKVGAVGVAALFHGLDPAASGFESQEAERCAGGQRGRAGVRQAYFRTEGGASLPFLFSILDDLICLTYSSLIAGAPRQPKKRANASWLHICAR